MRQSVTSSSMSCATASVSALISTADAYKKGAVDLEVAPKLDADAVIAENIDALDFAYLDSSRAETTNLSLIRSIQVSVLARAERSDSDYSNNVIYRNKQNRIIFGPANDNFRRRLLSMEIKSRNMGL